MNQLKAALEDVLGGRGRLVTLVGEPGIGKTRTSEELATYAGLRGALVLWGRCYEGGGAPPYWPWVQAIRSYVRDIDPDELRRQMGSSASVVAEIVTDVKDRLPELQPPPQMDDPDSARFRLFDSITSFLKTASQSQPLVIVLDDLHWSDQPSLMFLEFMARELNQSRVLLLCTYRDMELNRRHQLTVTLRDLARDRLYERVLLRGLTEADIARFIEIAAGFTAPVELSRTVQRHTEGNPLFVTEVIRDLVQSGELTPEKVAGRSSWSVRIPEGVREVIGRRLDRLSDRANEIFTNAAVIGRQFTHDALRELAEDTTEGQLLDVLDEALDAKLIEELRGEIGNYQFTHALIQETLTSELSSARTVRLHARIAETLERLYGDESDNHAAELVPHFVEAELILGEERSIHYSVLAGQQALAMTAPQQALGHFEHAVAIAGDGEMDARKARATLGLARALHQFSVGDQVLSVLEILKSAFDYYVSVDDTATIEAIALEPFTRVGTSVVHEIVETALNHAKPGTAGAGKILARLAISEAVQGDLKRASALLDQAFAVAGELDDPQVKTEALMARATVHSAGLSRSDATVGLAAYAETLESIRSISDPNTEALSNTYSAVLYSKLGRLDDALASAETGYQIGSRIRVRRLSAFPCNVASLTALAAGRWDEAEEWITRWDTATAGSAEDWMMTRRLILSSLRHPIERDAYIEPIEAAFQNIKTRMDVPFIWYFLCELSDVSYAVPDLGFQREINQFRELVVSHGPSFTYGAVFTFRWRLMGRGKTAVALQDREADVEPYQLLAPMNSLELGMSTDRVSGQLALLLDDHDAAVRHFEDALTFCRDNGILKELAWSCSDYAEMLRDRGDASRASANANASGISDREKAIELQDEALAITQELGMRPLTERILARREILRP